MHPGPTHIQTMRYIKGTLTSSIKYQQSTIANILHGYSDVDWACDKDTC